MKRPALETLLVHGRPYELAYKVVRRDMTSLGLRNNPTIMRYHPNMWISIPEGEERKGKCDEGGIWLARTLGSANTYRKYMWAQHHAPVRIFRSLIGEVLFVNDDRVKTDAVYLFEEIEDIGRYIQNRRVNH